MVLQHDFNFIILIIIINIIFDYLQFDLENDDYTRKVVQRLLS